MMLRDRTDLVPWIVSRYENPAYLEIGCSENQTYDRVKAHVKVGVDPVAGGNTRMSSDEFFAFAPALTFDVIFIDGDHSEAQVRRDVDNARRRLRVGGVIVMHDCLPLNERGGELDSCGEVWRVALELAADCGGDFALWPFDWGCGLLVERAPAIRCPEGCLDYSACPHWGEILTIPVALPTAIPDYYARHREIFRVLDTQAELEEWLPG